MICRFTNEFLRLVKRFFTSFKKEDLFAWCKYTKKNGFASKLTINKRYFNVVKLL